jgi:hypothetical protein
MVLLLALLAGLLGPAVPLGAAPHYHLALRPLGDTGLYHGHLALGEQPVTGICDLEFFSAGWPDALTLTPVPIGGGQLVVESAERNLLDESAPAELRVRCRGEDDSLQAAELSALPPPPAPAPVTGRSYRRIISVAPTGADFSSIQAAIDSVRPKRGERYLVRVAAGVYREWVSMRPNVDLEGAGESLTVLAPPAGGSRQSWATLMTAEGAELRYLTVENRRPDDHALAIYVGGVNTRLAQVTAIASGGQGFTVGVQVLKSSAVLRGITAVAVGGATNYGIFTYGGPGPRIEGSLAVAWDSLAMNAGVYNSESNAALHTSVVVAGGTGAINGGVVNIAGTPKVIDSVALASGDVAVRAVYAEVARVTAVRVTAVAAGGQDTAGIFTIADSNSSVAGATIQAAGATTSYALYNGANASLTVRDVQTRVFGGAGDSYGLYNLVDSRAAITASLLHVTGGNSAYGVVSVGGGAARLFDVRIQVSGASNLNVGLDSESQSTLLLTVGEIEAGGGNQAFGVRAVNSGTAELEGAQIAVLDGVATTTGAASHVDARVALSGTTVTVLRAGPLRDTGTAYGLYNSLRSGAVITSSAFEVTGGLDAYGLFSAGESRARFRDSHVTVSSARRSNTGLYSSYITYLLWSGGEVEASGGQGALGVGLAYTTTATIRSTRITASAAADAEGSSGFQVDRNANLGLSDSRVTATGGRTTTGLYQANGGRLALHSVSLAASGGETVYGLRTVSASPVLADVQILAAGGGYRTIGVSNTESSPWLTRVAITASGSTTQSVGLENVSRSTPVLEHVIITATGSVEAYGVFNYLASPVMTQVTITASGASQGNRGMFSSGGYTTTLRHVDLAASGGASAIGLLIGLRPTGANDGREKLPGLATFDYITATASGASDNVGIDLGDGFLTLSHAQATALGGDHATGIRAGGQPTMTLTNVTATASGAGSNIGIATFDSTVNLERVTALGSSGVEARGISILGGAPTLSVVTATASHGVTSIGLLNLGGARPALTDVTITASGGLTVFGLLNRDAPEPVMTRVTIDVRDGVAVIKRLTLGSPQDDR